MRSPVLFIPGLSVLLGLYGYLVKSPLPLPASDETETEPTVEVFIPALNEEETIGYAIASLTYQTVRPDAVTVVDDGSTDATAAVVEAVREQIDIEINFVRHTDRGSKTKRLKQVTRNSDADKIFVLDADTYLVSETYLERVIAAQEAEDVACSFGVVQPDTRSTKRSFHRDSLEPLFPNGVPAEAVPDWIERDQLGRDRPSYLVTRWPVEQYRSILYAIEQRFFKEAQMRLIRTSLFPAGCGVLYDRQALRSVFDDFEPSLGNQLTNSEDIFIGFSLVDRGFANVQVSDVRMRTVEPTLAAMADQTYLWSSSFLQSTFYYRVFSRWLRSRTGDVTDEIPRDEPGLIAEETTTVGTDGGFASPTDSERVGTPPTGAGSDEPTTPSSVRADRNEESPSVGVPTSADSSAESAPDREMAADRDSGDEDDDSGWFDRRRTLSAVVGSQIVDGLYPIALLVVGLLSVFGLFPIELLLAVVAVEFGLYLLIAGLFAHRQITLLSLLVSVPVRLSQLPVGVYVYARVATDLLRGKRNWNK